MEDRKLAAKLAEDYYSGSIDFKKLMMEYPEFDKDEEIDELYDLMEHEPPVSWFFGESQQNHDKRMNRINALIRKLKEE